MINDFAIENDLDAICICEHWCREAEIEFNKLDDYGLGNTFCRKQHLHGGVAIYIKANFTKHCKKLNFDCLNSEFDFKAIGVYIERPDFKLAIISLYKVTKRRLYRVLAKT